MPHALRLSRPVWGALAGALALAAAGIARQVISHRGRRAIVGS